mmetsp:Transcript_55366/g.157329  ORF Transcript_55366/g.157329 Transcript_55366/m.157329 type:complete len:93 (+) Transcript_55366:154-432(+)
MHDAAYLESRGVPTVAVISSAFKPQAAYQARMLGLEQVRVEFVQHPISDATKEQMQQKAASAFGGVLRALTSSDTSALQQVTEEAPEVACDS